MWGFVWDWFKEGMSLKDNSVSPCMIYCRKTNCFFKINENGKMKMFSFFWERVINALFCWMNYCVRKYICNFDTTIYVDPPWLQLVGQVAIREIASVTVQNWLTLKNCQRTLDLGQHLLSSNITPTMYIIPRISWKGTQSKVKVKFIFLEMILTD